MNNEYLKVTIRNGKPIEHQFRTRFKKKYSVCISFSRKSIYFLLFINNDFRTYTILTFTPEPVKSFVALLSPRHNSPRVLFVFGRTQLECPFTWVKNTRVAGGQVRLKNDLSALRLANEIVTTTNNKCGISIERNKLHVRSFFFFFCNGTFTFSFYDFNFSRTTHVSLDIRSSYAYIKYDYYKTLRNIFPEKN